MLVTKKKHKYGIYWRKKEVEAVGGRGEKVINRSAFEYFISLIQLIMIKAISTGIMRSLVSTPTYRFSTESEGASFLKMVESYFDKAARHTNIRSDILNFYKKPENVVKCTLTLVKGYSCYM